MVEMHLRSVFLTLGQVALAVIAVLSALVLWAGPSGTARVPGAIAAILVLVGAAWLIRGLRRQAIIVDGARLGWRGGLTGKVVGWTDLADVEMASTAQLSSSISRRHPDVILWTRTGGLTGLRAVLLRMQRPASAPSEGTTHAVDRAGLRPFSVPLSAFGDTDRATMRTLLDQRGLLPS